MAVVQSRLNRFRNISTTYFLSRLERLKKKDNVINCIQGSPITYVFISLNSIFLDATGAIGTLCEQRRHWCTDLSKLSPTAHVIAHILSRRGSFQRRKALIILQLSSYENSVMQGLSHPPDLLGGIVRSIPSFRIRSDDTFGQSTGRLRIILAVPRTYMLGSSVCKHCFIYRNMGFKVNEFTCTGGKFYQRVCLVIRGPFSKRRDFPPF